MTWVSEKRCAARLVVALLATSPINLPWHAMAFPNGPDEAVTSNQSRGPVAVISPSATEETLTTAIQASALRLPVVESRRLERGAQSAAAGSSDRCTASVAEKLAWLYAVVGGTILLAYGPREREGGVWTRDGKSETVGGAAAIVLSFALLHDIRHKGR